MLTAKNYQAFCAELVAAVADLEKKYEVKIRTLGAKSDQAGIITMKVQVSPKVAGVVLDPSIESFKINAWRYGLKPENLNQEFKVGVTKYTVYGLKTSNHKFPILAKSLNDGKIYKFPQNTVKTALAA